MLTLRRGEVVAVHDPAGTPMQRLDVRLAPLPVAAAPPEGPVALELPAADAGPRIAAADTGTVPAPPRPALLDTALLGPAEVGDDVVVNVAAVDLGLGSGGFDVVHVNLTRGLGLAGVPGAHVMKLNYSSLQHAVDPVESPLASHGSGSVDVPRITGAPVAVTLLHGQLAPVAWAFARASGGARLGFVQTAGGALPGALSEVGRELRGRGLLDSHITAGASYGGESEAITTAGALRHGFAELGWDAAVVGPGPGILGSGTALGHGGLHALDAAHTAAALGADVLIAARRSDSDRRRRHRGLSHHTRTLLELALVPFTVPTADIARPESGLERHRWPAGRADLDGYADSGLPSRTMGRSLREDPAFFASALACGWVLGEHTRR